MRGGRLTCDKSYVHLRTSLMLPTSGVDGVRSASVVHATTVRKLWVRFLKFWVGDSCRPGLGHGVRNKSLFFSGS